jgi:hypothetical protein
MITWIKENFGVKNFFILLTVIIIIAGFLAGPSIYKKFKNAEYKGTVKAEVMNMVARKSLSQHLNGINETVTGYDVTYIYSLQNKNFSHTEFIRPEADAKSLFDKFTSGLTCYIEVKYAPEAPSESIISKLNPDK